MKSDDKTIYCGTCRKPNTWVRQPERDIKSKSGNVLYEAYRCSTVWCEAKTVVKVNHQSKLVV